MIKIYHNNMCSKSCAALELIQKYSQDIAIREYIHDVPTPVELRELLSMLNMKPSELLRRKESLFQEKFKDLIANEEEWLAIIIKNPILMERPIIIKDGKAVIGRPIEKVIHLLS